MSTGVKKYFSFFRIRFISSIQYRAAALAGITTQFAWGFMTVLMYKAFYEASPEAFPMGIQEVSSYMWLRQAFLALFSAWGLDMQILNSITDGNVAYELTKPADIYSMWYTKNLSQRVANAALRFLPVLIVAAILPKPYGIAMPYNLSALIGFTVTLVLATLVMCSMLMIIYALTFFTMDSWGIRIIFSTLSEFLCGDLVPLPFFPEGIRRIAELTPFAATVNIPFRIYSGNISGNEILFCIAFQLIWLVVLVIAGKCLLRFALKRAVVQGG